MKKWLFSVLAFGLWAGLRAPVHALTLSDIETQVRRHIRDTSTTASLQTVSDTVLDAQINEIQRDIVNQTWCIENSTGITLSAGTTYYAMPIDMIVIYRVSFTDSHRVTVELGETSQTKIFSENADYERNGTGAPSEYFVRRSTYGANAIEFGIYPVPTSTSTGTVKIDYAAQATDMSSDSDVPFNGDYVLYPYHDALVYGATLKIKLMENKPDEVTNYAALYKNAVDQMKAKLNDMPGYRPNFSGHLK